MNKKNIFSTEERLRRMDYMINVILLSIILSILLSVLFSMEQVFCYILESTKGKFYFSEASESFIFITFILIGSLILVAMAAQGVKRLHDINMDDWYFLFFLVPIVNLAFGLYLLLKDGTPGPNKYGEDPKGRQILEKLT